MTTHTGSLAHLPTIPQHNMMTHATAQLGKHSCRPCDMIQHPHMHICKRAHTHTHTHTYTHTHIHTHIHTHTHTCAHTHHSRTNSSAGKTLIHRMLHHTARTHTPPPHTHTPPPPPPPHTHTHHSRTNSSAWKGLKNLHARLSQHTQQQLTAWVEALVVKELHHQLSPLVEDASRGESAWRAGSLGSHGRVQVSFPKLCDTHRKLVS